MNEGKICTKCNEHRTYNNYYKESKAPDGLKAKCKKCLYFVKRDHRERNKYLDTRFDPHATQFITFNQMSDFIGSLDPPLGIPKPNSLAIVSFDLPIAKVILAILQRINVSLDELYSTKAKVDGNLCMLMLC